MTGQQLKNSILQEAIQGRLVSNVLQPGEKTGAELLQDILSERQKKENEEKGKKAKRLSLSIIEDEPWELPDGWCWCKLGDAISLLSGRDLEPDKYNANHNGIPYITGASNFDRGTLLINRWTPKPGSVSNKGDLLITCKGTVGELAFNTIGDIHIARQIMAISAIIIDSKYIQVFLNAKVNDLNAQANGVIPGISREDILLADFPLPPLSIQKSIVSKIEELFPLVDEYEKAAVELNTLNEFLPDKLRKSVLQEAIHGNLVSNDIPDGEATAPELLRQILKERQDRENKAKGKKAKKLTLSTVEEEPWDLPEGWCWCKLGDVFEMQAGKNISASDIHDTKSEDYPYPCYGGNGVRGYVKNYNSTGIHTIVGRQGALCGNVKYAEGPFYATEHAVVVSMDYCDVMWSYHFLIACDLNLYATKTAQPGLSVAKILDTYFPLPPLSIQHRIVEKIEEVFAAIDKLKA